MADAKHVFISYCHDDDEHVDKLCEVLAESKIPYWRDRDNLWPGDDWKAAISSAIRSEALVFLACFSSSSGERDRSYMNEELTLAVEEYRKLPPGKTWLIPVRFDDVPIPEWSLGAGRMIGDLHCVDFFGRRESIAAGRLVATIGRLLGDPGPDTATVQAAVAQLPEEDQPQALGELTEEMLPDPARRIRLDQMIRDEGRKIIAALKDPERFPVDRIPGGTSEEQVVALARQAQEIQRLSEPFVSSLAVATRWATPGQTQSWADTLRALATEACGGRSGYESLLGLRYLPGTISTMACALMSVQSGRWENFKKLLVDQTIPCWRPDNHISLLNVFDTWSGFPGGDLLPNALARSALTGEDLAVALAAFADNKARKYHTPVAEWLHAVLRPLFADIYLSSETYDHDFDTAEVMLGLISTDILRRGTDQGRVFGRTRWFGRSTWRAAHGNNSPIAQIKAEVQAQQTAWTPLQAGLFGGQVENLEESLQPYEETFHKVAQRMW